MAIVLRETPAIRRVWVCVSISALILMQCSSAADSDLQSAVSSESSASSEHVSETCARAIAASVAVEEQLMRSLSTVGEANGTGTYGEYLRSLRFARPGFDLISEFKCLRTSDSEMLVKFVRRTTRDGTVTYKVSLPNFDVTARLRVGQVLTRCAMQLDSAAAACSSDRGTR